MSGTARARRRRVLAIVGPGDGASARDVSDAFEVAAMAAGGGWVVLTGGRDVGVMDAASRGAQSADGLAVGVLPHAGVALSRAVDVAIVTGIGEARDQVVVLSCDALVVCGMSAGTAVEVALAIKLGKPIALVRPTPTVRAFFETLTDDITSVASATAVGAWLEARAGEP